MQGCHYCVWTKLRALSGRVYTPDFGAADPTTDPCIRKVAPYSLRVNSNITLFTMHADRLIQWNLS